MQTGGFPRPFTGVRLVWFRRFSFEALIPSLVAQAPDVTAEHHPLMGSSHSWQHYWQPGSTFLDRRVLPRILLLFEAFPKLPVPKVVKPWFILPWTCAPPEFFATSLETSGPLVTGADLP